MGSSEKGLYIRSRRWICVLSNRARTTSVELYQEQQGSASSMALGAAAELHDVRIDLEECVHVDRGR